MSFLTHFAQVAQDSLRRINPAVEVRPMPAEDESVDDGADIWVEGTDSGISFQIGGGYYCLNQWFEAEETMLHHYEGRSIMDAIEAAKPLVALASLTGSAP